MKVGYIEVLPKRCYTKATVENGLVRADKCPCCNEWHDNIHWLGYENKQNHEQQVESAGFDGYIRANKICESCFNKMALEDRAQVYMLDECVEV